MEKQLSAKQRQKIYNEVLASTCGCYEDAVGNRPCDNGAVCDKCSMSWVQDAYKSKLAAASCQI